MKMKSTSKSRIILCGKAASGKDHLRKILEGRGFKYAVSFTTRPPRNGEVDGKDYFFIEESEFKDLIEQNFFYEHVAFNGWLYGTSKEQWYDTDDIFIMTPSGINKIKTSDRKHSFIIYIDVPMDIRRERLMMRNDADLVDRRIIADESDFEGFNDFDIRITDHNF
jgi:guanylate kinase